MRCMSCSSNVLIDRIFARLPLFDDLSAAALQRLAAAGFGRGLMTTTLRARLRRAGFVDMARLALATPGELTSVRKIGPVRLGLIRTHILDELARFDADARARHSEDATARRRIDRLRALPVGRFPFQLEDVEDFGHARAAPAARMEELDGIVGILVQLMQADLPRHTLPASVQEDDTVESGNLARDRAELLRARDREWEEADPTRLEHAGDRF